MMKVSIVQHIIRWNELEWNLNHLEQLLNGQSGTDLFVLSETFATGFLSDKEERPDAQVVVAWMQKQARRLKAAITGSVAMVDEAGLLRNRLYFVKPDGTYEYYDKRHLFSYAGENKAYVAGSRRVVVEWGGMRFLLQVCYDLRFPVFSRNRGDYDAIIYVANWPQKRREVWQTLLKARAIENQCYVIGVNCVGMDGLNEYAGDSVVINAYGHTIAQCTPSMEEIANAELNMEELGRFRKKIPVLADADNFSA